MYTPPRTNMRRAFDVDGAHGEAEQHDARMNQGRCRPIACLGDAADVKRGRGEIAQHNRGGPPEGNKGQRDGGGDHNLGAGRIAEELQFAGRLQDFDEATAPDSRLRSHSRGATSQIRLRG